RRPPPLNSVSPRLTCENLLTTACWFIEASTVLVREIALQLGVQIFGSVASSRSQLALCYAKSAPVALRCFCRAFPQNCRSVWNQARIRVPRFSRRAANPPPSRWLLPRRREL